MTLGGGSHTQSESVMLAFTKRKAQLERWRESDTERESIEIRNRPKRVKFADKCIFQAACASNDKNQVAKMIQDGYDINAVDEDGITALHQACIEDNLDMVEFLLKHGADVNISDNEGWTPLHASATCCYVSIVKLLLEHGANVVALNNDCSIPLDICKSDEIREIFIQDINAKGIDLKEARRGEELKMVEDARRWIHTGYAEDAHPTTGATALHVAACKGYIKVLDLLIKTSANINVKDFDGWTPLHAAAHWGQKEACEILLENNCDMSLKNNCDQTALDVADNSVFPVFEKFKRKRDVNKNVEKSFVPPTRDEESETQRKAHAKRVRETRRSTQGVTLEELKSAEQYVKNSLLATTVPNAKNSVLPTNVPNINKNTVLAPPPPPPVPAEQSNHTITSTVPVTATVPSSRKEDEASVERRPSWRLRVDEQDPSKFSLEDTRTLPHPPSRAIATRDGSSTTVQRSPSLRNRTTSNKSENLIHGKPPKPPEESDKSLKTPQDEEKEQDMKNSGAQGAILRKKKTKRRSTGIVQYSHDGTEIVHAITGSDAEVGSGSGPSSDLDQPLDSSKSENGVSTSINYRKLYEEVLKENQLLKGRLSKAEEDVADLRLKMERLSLTPQISSDDLERREKRALERKLSEMEEELKETRHLRTENQKLRDENGALIRVISKLSK